VFEGRVISIDSMYGKYDGREIVEYIMATFVVDQWISAHDVSDTVGVYTPVEESACGLPLAVGDRWLLFTHEDDGVQHTSYCSSSLKNSGSDRKAYKRAMKLLMNLKSTTGFVRDTIEWANGPYEISGNLKQGVPVGTWRRVRANQEIAVFNFNDAGFRQGYQMEIGEKYEDTTAWYVEKESAVVKSYEIDRKTLRSILEVNNGRRHGKFEFYYSGVKYLSATYVNGRLDGECITWYEEYVGSNPARKVKTIGQFHSDKRISFVRYDAVTGEVIE
jgi:hypothetical protein